MQACQCRSDGQPAEAALGDGTVDDSLVAKSIQKTSGDLVSVKRLVPDVLLPVFVVLSSMLVCSLLDLASISFEARFV